MQMALFRKKGTDICTDSTRSIVGKNKRLFHTLKLSYQHISAATATYTVTLLL